MKRSLAAIMLAASMLNAALSNRVAAQVPVIWDGSAGPDVSDDPDSNGKWRWEEGHWTRDGIPGQTASDAIGQDGNTGGRGGVDMIIGGSSVEARHK